jgi:hypothetical protein
LYEKLVGMACQWQETSTYINANSLQKAALDSFGIIMQSLAGFLYRNAFTLRPFDYMDIATTLYFLCLFWAHVFLLFSIIWAHFVAASGRS